MLAATLAASLAFAVPVAQHTFGPVCDGPPRIVRADLPGDRVGEARALVLPDGRRVACSIVLDPWAERARWRTCTVVLHEWGHLAGLEHSDNPRSVMYPSIERPDRRCRR